MWMLGVRSDRYVRSWIVCGVCCVATWTGCGSDAGMMMTPVGSSAPVAGMGVVGAAGSGGAGAPAPVAGSGVASAGSAGTAAAVGGRAGSAAGASAGVSTAAGSGAAAGSAAVAGSGAAAGAGAGGAAGVGGSGASGASGAAGSSAAGGGGASAAAGGGAHEDLGKGDGHDVVTLGDSYMSNSLQFEGTGGGIVPALQSASGQRYRNYAVQGTMLLMDNSYGPAIPKQWDQAKRANPDVKTVVMTAGGNDIIQSTSLKNSCMMGGDDCKQLLIKETMRFDELWTEMAEAGVQDIVHVRYATDSGTVAQSLLNDTSITPPAICSSGKVRCHDLETTDIIMGQRAADGIHPLQSANERVAKAIVELMAKEGMRR